MPTQPDPELLEEYKERVVPALREKHGYKNVHEIPKVAKVVVNCSVGAGADSKEALDTAKSEIGLITGQRPIPHHVRMSRASDEDVAPANPRLSGRFDEIL